MSLIVLSIQLYVHCKLTSVNPLAPSAPRNLVLESRTLSWDQPTNTFGEDLLRYEILVSSTEDVSNAEVLRNVLPDATSYTLTDEDLRGKMGSLYIWV